MPKLPDPPQRAPAQTPPVWRDLPAGTQLWRVYFRGGPYPVEWDTFRAFGPVRSGRFDHHLPPPREQERRIYYCAPSLPTCLAETFQEERIIDVQQSNPWAVSFVTRRSLRLLDLCGIWPTRAGASMAINSGPRYRARRWSQAIYEAYLDADGLWYASSMHANRPSIALYERAMGALPPTPQFHRALSDALLLPILRNAAYDLGYLMLPAA